MAHTGLVVWNLTWAGLDLNAWVLLLTRVARDKGNAGVRPQALMWRLLLRTSFISFICRLLPLTLFLIALRRHRFELINNVQLLLHVCVQVGQGSQVAAFLRRRSFSTAHYLLTHHFWFLEAWRATSVKLYLLNIWAVSSFLVVHLLLVLLKLLILSVNRLQEGAIRVDIKSQIFLKFLQFGFWGLVLKIELFEVSV